MVFDCKDNKGCLPGGWMRRQIIFNNTKGKPDL